MPTTIQELTDTISRVEGTEKKSTPAPAAKHVPAQPPQQRKIGGGD
jgi:hypothetical protein